MGAIAIVMLLGAVTIGSFCWLGHHVRRETRRRRQVNRVRAALAGRTTLAELRSRCGADPLPSFPSPRPATGAPDPVAVRGSTPVRAA
ncbi:hypothetical protein [Lentzea flaviverrucosa]|jgi:hypothetical protein|uniref:Uncharacterized protein n=1 Tax=Lentzea flaviverrucosa TaxID=200379 RepID=A0A1H9EUT2_9PSEU|nr:hypothetical protein [Lentzea flaviverrucosa]RDI35390.1 hypothetical protein DFR72_1011141 [Lentzea flaviverrucosa]SEQ29405.1 hypothetical protein SAMN05216195_10276 [Lentzea flaviverrucosa]